MVKHVVLSIGIAAVLLSVAACGGQVIGSPTTSAPGSGSVALPLNHPCSLLSSSDLQQSNASTPPSEDKVGGAPDCDITIPSGSLGVAIMSDLNLSQLNATGKMTDLRIGNHQAKQIQEAVGGGCYVAIGVSSSSRVDVSVETDNDADACPTAMKAAGLVEPHLPRG